MKKVVIFGVGKQWGKYKDFVTNNYEIVALVDNNKREYGGEKCFSLEELYDEYDMLLITPKDWLSIYNQCILSGIDKNKIFLIGLLPEIYQKRSSSGVICYGQHYDDLIISAIFSQIGIDKPSYLDLGANHPYDGSNTALFYMNDSRGVNIDANRLSIELFDMVRPEDVNVNIGVAAKEGEFEFYEFAPCSGLNTFSKDEVEYAEKVFGVKINNIIKVKVITLKEIIEKYCDGVFPDYLDCDIEGLDYEVLSNYDLAANGPKVICVEVRNKDFLNFDTLMMNQGYFRYCRIGGNSIYVKSEFRRILCRE